MRSSTGSVEPSAGLWKSHRLNKHFGFDRYRDYVDLSVAVATPKGLVTPVVRNAESMEMLQIEQEIANLGKKVGFFGRVSEIDYEF